MDKIEWRNVKGYEGYYKVSNNGSVLGIRGRILMEKLDTGGYLHVTLYKRGLRRDVRIHRLVAEAFIDNPFNKPMVHHKDEDTQNNRVDNLEWSTRSENGYAYYKSSEVDQIIKEKVMELKKLGHGNCGIAKLLNIHLRRVRRIVNLLDKSAPDVV